MTSFSAKKSVMLKTVYNKKKIKIFGMNMPFIFGMNMPFISSPEVSQCIFHLWLHHSLNMHFSVHSMKLKAYSLQKSENPLYKPCLG